MVTLRKENGGAKKVGHKVPKQGKTSTTRQPSNLSGKSKLPRNPLTASKPSGAKVNSNLSTGQFNGNVAAEQSNGSVDGSQLNGGISGNQVIGNQFSDKQNVANVVPLSTTKSDDPKFNAAVANETLTSGRPQSSTAQLSGSEKRKKRKKRKRIRRIIIAIVVIIVIGCGVLLGYLYNSQNFEIENININGVEHLTESEMLTLAAIPEDETLIRVDTEGIKSRLKLDAWIKDVDVVRVFPDTLEINVKERPISGIVEIPTSDEQKVSTTNSSSSTSSQTKVRNWAISSDYMWLMPIPDRNSEVGKQYNPQIYSDVAGVMHIVDVSPSVTPEIGAFCTDENIKNAIDVVSSMTTELKSMVKTVKASEANSTTLILKNGVEISLGTSEDIRDKERVCLDLLEKYQDKISYINVRNPQNPTWRAVE